MPSADESGHVAALLERLLTDAAFRREFRRDPVAVSRAGGLADLADELEGTSGDALQTLEVRESKSSLAGVLMAAAAEGVGAVELLRYLDAQQSLPPEVAVPVHQALTSPKLQAISPAPDPSVLDGAGAPAAHPVAEVTPAAPVDPSHAAASAPGLPAEHAVASQEPAPEIPHVHLSAEAQQELAAGGSDPRVVELLTAVSQHHDVSVSSVKGAIQIDSVDGEPVSAGNIAARELAVTLGDLHPSIRPTEIGTPWPIAGDGFVTGPAYENHIHIALADPAADQVPADQLPPPVEPAPVAGAGQAPDGAAPRSTVQILRAVDPDQHAAPSVPIADAAAVLPDGSDTYPGDGASKEQIAAWMARQAHKAGLPGELPVMASLVESGLTNVQGGDRDSVGFFQMRTGIWDEGPYQGFQQRPELQLKWFIDHALAVKQQRVASGDRAFLHDKSAWGDWIADVERPAEEYRGRYQLRLDEAQQLLHDNGPATPPAAAEYVQPALSPSAPVAPSGTAPPIAIVPQRAGGALADAVSATAPVPSGAGLETMTIDGVKATGSPVALKSLETAFSFKGTPYHWGGSSPQTGFDCSGLTQWAYKQAGIDISRVTYTQVNDGVAVQPDIAHLQAGDLLFFRDSSGDNHHTGMYIGNGMMIHAPHTGDVVKVSSLKEPYYQEQFFAARRIAPPDPNAVMAPPGPEPTAGVADEAAAASVNPAAAVPGSAVLKAVAPPAAAGPRNTVQFLPAIDPEQQEQLARQAAPHEAAPADAVPPDSADAAAVVSDAYPGDGASREQIAAWMARQAEKAGLPRELPVMAALVESNLTNVQGGDRDSVGFFQMRTGIWDSGPYQGFQQRPELQLKWFIDHAIAVRDQRLHAGDDGFLTDPSRWGDWIADVERPAEEYRGRYQLRLDEAQQLLGSPAA